MISRKTITIVTSPPLTQSPLPTSPTTKQPIQYRIEERRRTLYVTSDVSPAKWDPVSLNTIFTLAEVPENAEGSSAEQPVRRSKSFLDTQSMVDDIGSRNTLEQHNNSGRSSLYHSRRPVSKSATSLLRVPSDTPPDSPRRNSPQHSPKRSRILFYHKHDPYYGFTNFSQHPVNYRGKRYPTSEHLFQSFKFQDHRPNLAEHIRTCSERPSVAFSEARRFQPEIRRDWMQVNIQKMDEALWHKFNQHLDLKAELLATGDAELVEDSDKDAFWGVGADGRGRNELGKALERLRTKLSEAA